MITPARWNPPNIQVPAAYASAGTTMTYSVCPGLGVGVFLQRRCVAMRKGVLQAFGPVLVLLR